MMNEDTIIHYLIFRVIRISGFLFLLGLLFTALATGQAEVSYKFWGIGSLIYLIMLGIARIEGKHHHINKVTKLPL